MIVTRMEEEEENNPDFSKSESAVNMSEKSGDDIKEELKRNGSSIARAAGMFVGKCI